MRSYQCFLYYENKEGELEKNTNDACYAGLNSFYIPKKNSLSEITNKIIADKGFNKEDSKKNTYVYYFKQFGEIKYYDYISIGEIANNPRTIYIRNFEEKETKQYIDDFIYLLNTIVPTEIVEIKKIKYIKTNLLHTYDQSLIFLNFIRNLWYSPRQYYVATEDFENEYYNLFFKNCFENEYTDPISKLCYANKIACKHFKNALGHSNVNDPSKINIKTVEDLKNFKENTSINFFL